ncbi:hypothetical protein T484DRAFT_3474264, partial [Baffinella frigidus]
RWQRGEGTPRSGGARAPAITRATHSETLALRTAFFNLIILHTVFTVLSVSIAHIARLSRPGGRETDARRIQSLSYPIILTTRPAQKRSRSPREPVLKDDPREPADTTPLIAPCADAQAGGDRSVGAPADEASGTKEGNAARFCWPAYSCSSWPRSTSSDDESIHGSTGGTVAAVRPAQPQRDAPQVSLLGSAVAPTASDRAARKRAPSLVEATILSFVIF